MKNIVDIIYRKGEKYPQISINGEKISRYMELSDLIYDDMFNWADRMYESLDDELAEQYVINLTGHQFHMEILTALRPQSQYCTEIIFTPITYTLPMGDKLAYARELNQKYALGIDAADTLQFFSDDPAHFASLVTCTSSPSDYYITYNSQLPESHGKYCVVVSEQVRFLRQHSRSYLHLPQRLLPVMVDYFQIYHVSMSYISAVFSASDGVSMDKKDRLEFEAYSMEEYRILTNPLPTKLECGEQFRMEYCYFPKCFADPKITLATDAPAVALANGKQLTACAAGSCNVQLVDQTGKIHGTSQLVVEKHNYVNNISVVLPFTSMCVNTTMHFKTILSPNDAEDINNVRYTVSDESIAVISNPNELYALSAGRVCVTISTTRASRKMYITVLPSACDVVLPEKNLRLPINATADVSCSVVPMNATPMPTATWYSSDPNVVRIISQNDKVCKLLSVNPGVATVTCSLNDTAIHKNMVVTVEKEGGCYVATAVYGSYDCPQVWMLRRYRDQFLAKTMLGRAFIKLYYAVSPTAVSLFGTTKWFNKLFRGILDRKLSKLREKGYEDTPYND